ncbi:hypothetical protein L5515_000322 [Caenorhabditis briggsae]|uniref:Uncharacterized protein n=1 Tax=Caenorhabditis briggsae TaxID=6238 RepID=A0AAE9E213_CAEBR|nr:hypothetical protein L5515_000322 [Caenorhabditis briggsae]
MLSILLLICVSSTWTQPILTSSQAPPTFSTPEDPFGMLNNQDGVQNLGLQNQNGFFGNAEGSTTPGAFFGANSNGGFQNQDNQNLNQNSNGGGFFGGNNQQQQSFQTLPPNNNQNFFGSQNDASSSLNQNQGFQNQNQNQNQNQQFGNQGFQNQGFQNQNSQNSQNQQFVQSGQLTSGQQGVNQGFPISNAFPTNRLPPIFGRKK